MTRPHDLEWQEPVETVRLSQCDGRIELYDSGQIVLVTCCDAINDVTDVQLTKLIELLHLARVLRQQQPFTPGKGV